MAIRERTSICDVSHMGEIEFKGKDALALVQRMITNDAGAISDNQVLYTVMCDDDGFIIDDLVCFRIGESHFIWVVNVTKIEQDLHWILKHSHGMDVSVDNRSCELALMAVQGPRSREVIQRVAAFDLSLLGYFRFVHTVINTSEKEVPCLISRTGYTGSYGFEIMVEREMAPMIWDELLLCGRPLGIIPHGVAARESARTEAGLLLNGNDMDETTTPFEAGLGWVVKFQKDFIGKKALLEMTIKGLKRKLVGIEVQGRCPVRHGYPILKNGHRIGTVTSGPLPAGLANRNLGMGFVQAEYSGVGTEFHIMIRGAEVTAKVVPKPFFDLQVGFDPETATFPPYALRFSSSHVWAQKGQNNHVIMGLTDFAQQDLGDILFAQLPRVGDAVSTESPFAWVDTYRKTFDLLSPFDGEVIEINERLGDYPEEINKFPYSQAGVVTISVSNIDAYDHLYSFSDYRQVTNRLRRYEHWSEEKRTT